MSTLKDKVFGKSATHMPNIQDEAGVMGTVSGIGKYKLRMVAALGSKDHVVMPEDVQNDARELLDLYDEYGLDHTSSDNILFLPYAGDTPISHAALAQIQTIQRWHRNRVTQVFHPFIHSPQSDAIASRLGLQTLTNTRASELVNDKALSQRELHERGVLTPIGKLVKTADEARVFFDYLNSQGYNWVGFKIPRSASGMGVFTITRAALDGYLEQYAHDLVTSGILLDGWIEGEKYASPNIQYCIGDCAEKDVFLFASDQILDANNVHRGNINMSDLLEKYPQLERDMLQVREWTREQGYRGIIGADFLMMREGDKVRSYYMEINARINGSTPGGLLADKITGSAQHTPWALHNNIAVPAGSTLNDFLLRLRRTGLEFDPSTKQGVLVTNGSAIAQFQKVMVVALGKSRDAVREMLLTIAQ